MHLVGPSNELRRAKVELETANCKPIIRSEGDVGHIYLQAQVNVDGFRECPGCPNHEIEKTPHKSKKARKHYAIYPPMILLPTGTEITEEEARALLNREGPQQCTHVAINSTVQTDCQRSPHIIGVLGDFGVYDYEGCHFTDAFWSRVKQNGVWQTWAPLYTMFSRGNITEKLRVLHKFRDQRPIMDSTVVDLYCGIGYFTLNYAMNAPRRIYCWELNPWSIEGLVRGARMNNFGPVRVVHENERYVYNDNDYIVVFNEDNQRALDRLETLNLTNLSHINMGMLPNAWRAIPVAKRLSERGTVVHLHENIPNKDISRWVSHFSKEIGSCIHVEEIKQYSPALVHVCGDFIASVN